MRTFNPLSILKKIALALLILLILVIAFLSLGRAPQAEEISWGVTFSQKYAEDLGFDWREVYLALIDDLGAKKIRIAFHWDTFEPERGQYNYDDLDWKIRIAEERGVKVIPVIGIKVPRWPECHIPLWAEEIGKEAQQERVLKKIEKIVVRYRESEAILSWQVENEPFLKFGNCPWYDKSFLFKEIDLVRSLDPETPILITESGEQSTWFPAARIADIVGTTMYRRTWWHSAGGFYAEYPIPAVQYYRKAWLIDLIFGKEVICVELQAEPWGPAPTYVISLEEQEKTMTPEIFKGDIEYAKNTGLSTFYFWGAEWWYWMKEKHNQPEYWQEAQKLFQD